MADILVDQILMLIYWLILGGEDPRFWCADADILGIADAHVMADSDT